MQAGPLYGYRVAYTWLGERPLRRSVLSRFSLGPLGGRALLAAAASGALFAGHGCSSSSPSTPKTVTDAGTPDGAVADGGATDAAPTPKKTWDWTGIVGTGQSLSVGAQGTPINLSAQPYNNLKLSLGFGTFPPFDPTSAALSMVPLTEPIRTFATTYPSAYPLNIDGETPHTAMADEITSLYNAATGGMDYVTVHTVVGESGQPMSVIDKAAVEVDDGGTSMGRAYAATLFEATAIQRLATAANKTYGIGGIVLTHGESDSGNTDYESDLVQLWTDYNTDLAQITGQTASIPMFLSQQHSTPETNTLEASMLAQWKVGIDHPNDIICTGPKYQYPYFSDGVHLLTPGYDALGEKYAEVYYQKVVLGQPWAPLQPKTATSVTRAGAVITVQFHVPVEPMVFDTTLPPPHAGVPQWANGQGFEVSTIGGAPLQIDSVAIAGDSVVITCDDDLTGLALNVSYAFFTDATTTSPPVVQGFQPGTFRWGLLRDSDTFVGSTTHQVQPNFAVAFSISSSN
jgi:hypothetical protein